MRDCGANSESDFLAETPTINRERPESTGNDLTTLFWLIALTKLAWRRIWYVYLPPECRLSLSSSVTFTRIESSPMDFMSSTVMYRYCCWSLSIGSSPAVNIWLNKVDEWTRICSRERTGRVRGDGWDSRTLEYRRVRMSCTICEKNIFANIYSLREYAYAGENVSYEPANKEETIAKYIVAIKLKKRGLVVFWCFCRWARGLSNDSESLLNKLKTVYAAGGRVSLLWFFSGTESVIARYVFEIISIVLECCRSQTPLVEPNRKQSRLRNYNSGF